MTVKIGALGGWTKQPDKPWNDGSRPLNSRPFGNVWITGTVEQGQILTCNNTLSDADTLGTFSYQWYNTNVGAISGATASTYTAQASDVGYKLYCTISYTDGASKAESKTSVQTIAVVGTGGTPSWQLAAGHYEPTYQTAELIFPRPDAETPVWAKHRRHAVGVPYRIPIGVAFGSWPYYFEIDATSAAKGITVGSWLTTSGDKLIVGADYGVVSWSNPTAGSHTITVTVNFQDGTTPLNVTWTLEVTNTGTIYVDGTLGNDTTGDGSFANPFKTLDGWFLADNTDRTYTQYQVCYRAGTYSVYTADPATTGNMKFDFLNKPLVHYKYPGEIVKWDFSLANITSGIVQPESSGGEYHFSDFYTDIDWIGGPDKDNPRRVFLDGVVRGPLAYDGTGGGQRNTWFESNQTDWTTTRTSSNNAGIVFASNTNDVNKRRNYWYVGHLNFTNINGDGNPNWNGFYLGNSSLFLTENVTCSNLNFARNIVLAKSSEYRHCYRNIDASACPDMPFVHNNAGSYAPLVGGGSEISYCKSTDIISDAAHTVFTSGDGSQSYDTANPYNLPNYEFRNSWSKSPATLGECFRAFNAWPVYSYNDVWCSQGDGIYLSGPVNTQANGDWRLYAIASNPFDANLNLTGTPRADLLGTHGAEIA